MPHIYIAENPPTYTFATISGGVVACLERLGYAKTDAERHFDDACRALGNALAVAARREPFPHIILGTKKRIDISFETLLGQQPAGVIRVATFNGIPITRPGYEEVVRVLNGGGAAPRHIVRANPAPTEDIWVVINGAIVR